MQVLQAPSPCADRRGGSAFRSRGCGPRPLPCFRSRTDSRTLPSSPSRPTPPRRNPGPASARISRRSPRPLLARSGTFSQLVGSCDGRRPLLPRSKKIFRAGGFPKFLLHSPSRRISGLRFPLPGVIGFQPDLLLPDVTSVCALVRPPSACESIAPGFSVGQRLPKLN